MGHGEAQGPATWAKEPGGEEPLLRSPFLLDTSNHISSPPCAHSSVVPSLPPPPSVEDLEEGTALTVRSLGTHGSRGTAPSGHFPNDAIRSKRCMKPPRYGCRLSQQLAHPDTLFYPVAALLPGEHRITWAIQGTKAGGREARRGFVLTAHSISSYTGPLRCLGLTQGTQESQREVWWLFPLHVTPPGPAQARTCPARSPQVHTPGH